MNVRATWAVMLLFSCSSADAPFLVEVESTSIPLTSVEALVLQLAPGTLSESFSMDGTGSFYEGSVRTRVAPAGELVITIDRPALEPWVTSRGDGGFSASIPLRPGGGGGQAPTLSAVLFDAGSSEVGNGATSLPWPLVSGDSVRVRVVP